MQVDPQKITPIWREVLKLLDCEAPTALPCRSRCPVCKRSQLSIFEDFAHSGQWSFCSYCRKGRDIPQLVMAAWGVDLDVAVSRLRRAGIASKDLSLDSEREKRVTTFGASENFWKKIAARHPSDVEGSQELIDKLGWNCRVSAELRAATSGELYAVATRPEIDRFSPNADYVRGDDDTPREWKETVAVPFTDLPGRLCGLLMIGRNADPERDFCFKPFFVDHEPKGKKAPWIEGGLAMHPLATQASRRWSSRMFVTRDVEIGIRLQCSHLEREGFPLPIAIWQNRRQKYKDYRTITQNAWAQLYNRNLTFWMPKLCGATMAQAIRQNSVVSMMTPPDGIDWDSYFRYRHPADVMSSIFAEGNSWKEIFLEVVASASDQELEQFLVDIEEFGISVRDLDLPDTTKSIIRGVMGDGNRVKMVTYHGMTLAEQGEAWYRFYAKSKPELLMDASLEVTHAIHQPTEDRVLYKGFVNHHGEKVAFCAPSEKIEKRALSFTREVLLAHRKGLVTFPYKYDTIGLHVAMQFSNPQFVTGLDRVGWSSVDNALVLPAFSLPLGGEVKEHDKSLFLEGAPCSDWGPPQGLASADVDVILEADPNGLLLDILSATLANMIAPGLPGGSIKHSIALCGLGACQTTKRFIEASGGFVGHTGEGASASSLLDKQAARHDFPVYVDRHPTDDLPGEELSCFRRWIKRSTPNTAVPLNRWQALTKLVERGWVGIEAVQPVWFNPGLEEAAKNLATNYLRDIAKRHLELPDSECLVSAVRLDIEQYITRCLGKQGPFGGSCLIGHTAQEKANAFAELLSRMVLDGHINFVIDPETKPNKSIWEADGELFIPKNLFLTTAYKVAASKPNREAITYALTSAGKLISETESYWIVNCQWWGKNYSALRTLENRTLKVKG